MSISDAIRKMTKARWEYDCAQSTSTNKEYITEMQKQAETSEKAVDDAIAMLIQNELGDILAKIKELTK